MLEYRASTVRHEVVAVDIARLIVQGWGQRHGIDCGGTYAPVSRFSSQLVLMAIAAERGYVVTTMDVVTAFLQSKVEEEVYVRQATGLRHQG